MYFQATEEVLWKRIQKRGARWQQLRAEGKHDNNPEYAVSRDLLRSYLSGFNVPQGEGEIVVVVEEG